MDNLFRGGGGSPARHEPPPLAFLATLEERGNSSPESGELKEGGAGLGSEGYAGRVADRWLFSTPSGGYVNATEFYAQFDAIRKEVGDLREIKGLVQKMPTTLHIGLMVIGAVVAIVGAVFTITRNLPPGASQP